jgi:hypothetical protein
MSRVLRARCLYEVVPAGECVRGEGEKGMSKLHVFGLVARAGRIHDVESGGRRRKSLSRLRAALLRLSHLCDSSSRCKVSRSRCTFGLVRAPLRCSPLFLADWYLAKP